ncbi:GspMb/PilO family protein [Paracidovorax cattleyae]|uniref:GspMb/PilO family protein n=1 Tax=Paracidovorax cattleyae TaxID=80868 RepID=UPI0018AFDDE8|nr:hypothetical protein [Paracidovorax cattleyae]
MGRTASACLRSEGQTHHTDGEVPSPRVPLDAMGPAKALQHVAAGLEASRPFLVADTLRIGIGHAFKPAANLLDRALDVDLGLVGERFRLRHEQRNHAPVVDLALLVDQPCGVVRFAHWSFHLVPSNSGKRVVCARKTRLLWGG